MQKFQSRAARVITGETYDIRSTDILNSLSWETLDNRRKKTKAVFMYKVLNDHAAPSLKESLYERNVMQNRYNLRNSEYDLTIPRPRTEYLRRSFKQHFGLGQTYVHLLFLRTSIVIQNPHLDCNPLSCRLENHE